MGYSCKNKGKQWVFRFNASLDFNTFVTAYICANEIDFYPIFFNAFKYQPSGPKNHGYLERLF